MDAPCAKAEDVIDVAVSQNLFGFNIFSFLSLKYFILNKKHL